MNGRWIPLVPALAMLGLAVWMLSNPAPARGAQQRIVCPDSLPAGAVQSRKDPQGWRLLMPQEAYLSAAGLVGGPPDESGYLKPLESKGDKTSRRSTWRQRWDLGSGHLETWAYCGYGGGSAPLQLFTRVADEATECTLTSTTSDGVIEQMVFVCR